MKKDELKKIVSENKTILLLEKNRVFALDVQNDSPVIFEMCDGYFGEELTKEMCLDLRNFFDELLKLL